MLGELVTDKLTDNIYNEKGYIDKKLTDNGMTPIGDNIVYVDGWQFEIDRSKPKIVQGLGKGELEKQINIDLSSTITSDYVSGTVRIEITYEGEIESITLNGNEITVPQKQDGKYVIEQPITDNGNYSVIARDKDEKFNIESTKVTDITEDMEIWNKEDMVAFRKKVNDEGRTFETKKAIVMADIDLKGSDSDQWVPINGFQGTFEGNYHTIDNLYIKSNSYRYLGLFIAISNKVTIQNTILKNVTIQNTFDNSSVSSFTGMIAGQSSGKIINCGVESGNIIAIKRTKNENSIIYNTPYIGGIVGIAGNCEIKTCYNKANLQGENVKDINNTIVIGGIVAATNSVILDDCYNQGNINSIGGYNIVVGGLLGDTMKSTINNIYNTGKITSTGLANTTYTCIGGIAGRNGNSNISPAETITNSYCTKENAYSYCYWNGSSWTNKSTQGLIEADTLKGYATTLGDAYTSDTTNINNGYPILKWQIEHKQTK